jgi:hypothetical protein
MATAAPTAAEAAATTRVNPVTATPIEPSNPITATTGVPPKDPTENPMSTLGTMSPAEAPTWKLTEPTINRETWSLEELVAEQPN